MTTGGGGNVFEHDFVGLEFKGGGEGSLMEFKRFGESMNLG